MLGQFGGCTVSVEIDRPAQGVGLDPELLGVQEFIGHLAQVANAFNLDQIAQLVVLVAGQPGHREFNLICIALAVVQKAARVRV